MNYEINDLHHRLIITLDTDSTNTSNLYLRVYKNNLTIPNTTTYTYNNGKFTIPHSDFNLGDVIYKFELVQSGNTKPWKTQEGVQILLNGNETNTEVDANGQFKMTFKESGKYDIQAVYVGNNANQFASTDKRNFTVNQPTTISGDPQNDGAYNIRFVDDTTPTMTYKDGTEVKFLLTKGGVPLHNKEVNMINTNGNNGTGSTQQGYTSWTNSSGNSGTYKLGAIFYDPSTHKVITSTFRTVTINKGTPSWWDNAMSGNQVATFYVGGKYKAHLEYRGNPMTNTKVDVYVNGTKTTRTTTSTGLIAYSFKSKGTYNLKLVYKGDNNYNQAVISRKITVVEE